MLYFCANSITMNFEGKKDDFHKIKVTKYCTCPNQRYVTIANFCENCMRPILRDDNEHTWNGISLNKHIVNPFEIKR